jgi:ligand-binding SRPBCC domain-containing protein
LNQTTKDIQEGTKIDYRLSLHGIPLRWQSQITDWQPDNKFSDIQLKGPYSHWYHTHEFVEKDGGTLVRDKLQYRVPFGIPGDVVAGKWIKDDLETIFKHRHKTIEKLMGA